MCPPDLPTDDAEGWDRRQILTLATGLLVPFLPLDAQAGPPHAGTVSSLVGSANAQQESARRDLTDGANVFIGDTVETGADSRVSLQLGATTLVRLGARARLTIDRFTANAGGELNLQSGAMLFDRKSQGAPRGSTMVRTPYGLMAVRGTRFWAGWNRGGYAVFVDHGRVDVSAAGRTVRLRRGEGTDIARSGSAPTRAVRWGAARIEEALATVN